MKVLIAGGNGLIGSRLAALIREQGGTVSVLTRRVGGVGADGTRRVQWDGRNPGEWQVELEGAEALVNLAGGNLGAGAWSPRRKAALLASRVDSTRALAQAALAAKKPPRVFMQASAIGFYGSHGDEPLDEQSPLGSGFLADICQAWEAEAAPVKSAGIRLVTIRTGLVLDKNEGALGRMLLPYRFFIGGPLGSGRQWYSWIHPQDQVEAMLFLLKQETLSGVFNLTAPNPLPQDKFGRALANTLRRPHWLPVPAFALRLLLGEMSSLVLEGQKVLPSRLLQAGYAFRHPNLDGALRELLQ